jgi:Transcriptional Coactivator p15 (PC4)
MSCNESPSSKRQKTLRAEPRIKLISENVDQSSECLDDGEDVREGKSESIKDSSKLINISTKSNSEGDAYWELSTQRRITVRSFKGNVLVDIREVRNSFISILVLKLEYLIYCMFPLLRCTKRMGRHCQGKRASH